MHDTRRLLHGLTAGLGLLVLIGPGTHAVRADTIVLKNGITYRGTVDKDNTILWIYDGLKRVVLRNTKVTRTESDASFRGLETFRVEQPLTVHGGSMPKEVLSVHAEPWSDRGRRAFAYEGARIGKFIRMEQAINELGPHLVKFRGVDGYWQSQLATNEVPRDIVLAILGKVDRKDRNERIRVARFLIQAEWYAEARAELDRILADFPDDRDLKDRVAAARASVVQLAAVQIRAELERCRVVGQPRRAATLARTFPTKDVSAELIAQVRETERAIDAQAAADKALADEIRNLSDKLPKERRKTWESGILEILAALRDAPDAVRDRFTAVQKARAEGGKAPEALFALAVSGYMVGSDAAVDDLETAATLWTLRDQVRGYLAASDAQARSAHLARIDAISLPSAADTLPEVKVLETLTRLAQKMPPPLHDDQGAEKTAASPRIHRVRDDVNAEPTEYMVSLPPEYHPLRSYPAIVALHDGTGPQAAIAWWAAEAARHGYIVVAPEYRLPGQGKEYHYSTSEHAAVELALRDARRRYAIDSDRVFLGGQLVGANMAWDFGLAHPDEFAGLIVVSGMPFKYANRYLAHADRLPLYVALGDLAPASNEVVFGQMLKPLILRGWDVTYLEYMKRGLEDLPLEAGASLDWADHRRRDPYPKAFEAISARESDNRFYGVVIREFGPGRTTAPEAADPFGKNLNPVSIKMKSSAMSNLLNFTTSGAKRFDVWLSPTLIDFKKRIEVRVNNRHAYIKGLAKPFAEPFLEDLRLRGDRQQFYWMKVPVG